MCRKRLFKTSILLSYWYGGFGLRKKEYGLQFHRNKYTTVVWCVEIRTYPPITDPLWPCMVFFLAGFPHVVHVQYRSKVSWQSLEPRSSSLETRYSILDSFEYRVSRIESRVSSIELRVEKVNELVAWLISQEINCTNGLPVLRAIVPLSLVITKIDCKHR